MRFVKLLVLACVVFCLALIATSVFASTAYASFAWTNDPCVCTQPPAGQYVPQQPSYATNAAQHFSPPYGPRYAAAVPRAERVFWMRGPVRRAVSFPVRAVRALRLR